MTAADCTAVVEQVQIVAIVVGNLWHGIVQKADHRRLNRGCLTRSTVALAGDLIGVTNSNHRLARKRGSIQAAWTQGYNGAVRVGLVNS